MKIAIVVHGRFDAFELARALAGQGHSITVLTNYPAWAAERFGIPAQAVRSCWPHGVLARLATRCGAEQRLEAPLHRLFGRWASHALRGEHWDVAYLYSGVAEESLHVLARTSTLRLVLRASAHIRTQDRLLREEELRTGSRQDRPSPWRIAREEREYALADRIRVLSSFAYHSFLEEGVPASKVSLLLSGANLEKFRAAPDHVDARCRRLLGGEPMRVLTVGSFSFRKGVWDMAAVVRALQPEGFAFRCVGPVLPEAAELARRLRNAVTFLPKQPEANLPVQYAWGDLFVLPSIEDGYQAVLGQAAAAALPIVTTPNGAGSDIVQNDRNGWIVPIRNPAALIDRLRWANAHRSEVAETVRSSYERFQPRDSAQVATDFEAMCIAARGVGGAA